MTLDALDSTMWLAGVGMEMVLLALLTQRRAFRVFPVFCFYQVCCLGSDAACWLVLRFLPASYMLFFLVDLTVDALFQLAILAELGASVVRQNHAVRPSRTVLGLLMVLACALLCLLAKWMNPSGLPIVPFLYVILLQAYAILRVAALLALAWWSSLQGLYWPLKELRIASGLGFYSVVSLAAIILHSHNMTSPQYHWIDQVQVFSYFCVLSYWVLIFSKSEPKSRKICSHV
ncbi:MAG: hypothetical protein P4K97_01455 [Terracidiphilus sp.]|nr:hypothetical protein [Terracidiphilus sp.]